MIPIEVQAKLAEVEGLMLVSEAQKLAEIAASVPKNQIIVEIGAFRGLSSCWLAAGAKYGLGAHVYSVDVWDDDNPNYPDTWPRGIGAYEGWQENVSNMGLTDQVTQIRSDALQAKKYIQGDVGFFFHDADHSNQAVARDFLAWSSRLVDGGWYATHDFYQGLWDENGNMYRTEKYITAVERKIQPTGKEWTDITIVDSLWSGRRYR